MNLRQTASSLEKITHKFTRELNQLTNDAEYLKYKSYVDERSSFRSGSGGFYPKFFIFVEYLKKKIFCSKDPRYHTSSVRQELRDTLSKLDKATHHFIREHDELANRAEYLKYTDFVRQKKDASNRNKSI